MKDILKSEPRFRYMMLDRMRQDCEYYLGYGNRNPKALWAGEEKAHIQNMKDIWNSFADEDKPEWLTMDEIEEYETEMRCNPDEIFKILKENTHGLDAVYEDYIIELVGNDGLDILRSNRLIETCGVINGRQLYALVK